MYSQNYLSETADDVFTGKQDKILQTNHSAEICSRAIVSFLTIRGEEHGVSHGTAVSVKGDEELVCTNKYDFNQIIPCKLLTCTVFI